ncbi:MAG: DUF4129 domain-containing protein [Chloroflexota bacterium]|nr:MAG: DUF4129 domain-containing protein [Chloroflexota bacterium]
MKANRWRSLRSMGIWFNFALLTLVVCTIVWSVNSAGWVDSLPSLIVVALLGLCLGFLFSHMSVVPAVILHPVALFLGTFVTIWQTIVVMSGSSLDARIVDLVLRVNNWGFAARTGGINNDGLVFVFFVVATTWLLAYLAAWFVFRHRQVWLGVLPIGVAGLVNLSWAPANLAPLYVVYLMLVLLLVMRVNLGATQDSWRINRVQYPSTLPRRLFWQTALFGVLVLVLAWVIPTTEASPQIADLWYRATSPWQDAQMEFNRLFGSVAAKEGGLGEFARTMTLRGEVNASNKIVMTVTSPEPHYWRGIAYDRYTGEGWIKTDRPSQPQTPAASDPVLADVYLLRKEITQTFHLDSPLRSLLFAAGQPIAASVPFQPEGLPEPPVEFNFMTGQNVENLSPELQEYAASLRTPRAQPGSPNRPGMRRGFVPEQLAQDLPPEWRIVSYQMRGNLVVGMSLERARPRLLDIVAVHHVITPKQRQYTVVSSVSEASIRDLRQAGTDYPNWVSSQYLALPATLPTRVRDLAQEITQDAPTPFDKATALESYLRTFTYTTKLPTPPVGRDVVDFMFFDTQKGYCDYFASGLAVTLRSIGIPARVVSGYQPGDYDPSIDAYVVRGTNAHSWVEVFFPSFGWIEFEPSPSRPLIERDSGEEPPEQTVTAEESTTTSSGEEESVSQPLAPENQEPGLTESVGALMAQAPGLPAWPLMLLLLVPAGAAVIWYLWRRGLGNLAPAELCYEKMCRLATLGRKGPHAWQTPMEYAEHLSNAVPSAAQPIQRIAFAYTHARFARHSLSAEQQKDVLLAWGGLWRKLLLGLWKK